MATITVSALVAVDPAQLTTSLATLYTAVDSKFQLTTIVLVNDTVTPVTATIHSVPSGGSADDTNKIIGPIIVPVDGTPLIFNFPEHYIETGGLIRGVASVTNQVTYHISGKELNVV